MIAHDQRQKCKKSHTYFLPLSLDLSNTWIGSSSSPSSSELFIQTLINRGWCLRDIDHLQFNRALGSIGIVSSKKRKVKFLQSISGIVKPSRYLMNVPRGSRCYGKGVKA